MAYLDKITVTFHGGSNFLAEGIEKEPYAKITINRIVPRDLVDQICELMRESMNEMGESCTIKIQSEDWDC